MKILTPSAAVVTGVALLLAPELLPTSSVQAVPLQMHHHHAIPLEQTVGKEQCKNAKCTQDRCKKDGKKDTRMPKEDYVRTSVLSEHGSTVYCKEEIGTKVFYRVSDTKVKKEDTCEGCRRVPTGQQESQDATAEAVLSDPSGKTTGMLEDLGGETVTDQGKTAAEDPQVKKVTVFSMRHGQSVGNFCAKHVKTCAKEMFLRRLSIGDDVADGMLTGLKQVGDNHATALNDEDSGYQQALDRVKQMTDATKDALLEVKAVVTSPLSRALMTGAAVYMKVAEDRNKLQEDDDTKFIPFIVHRDVREKAKSDSDRPTEGKWRKTLEVLFGQDEFEDSKFAAIKAHIRGGVESTIECTTAESQKTCMKYPRVDNGNELTVNYQIEQFQEWLLDQNYDSIFLASHSGTNRYSAGPIHDIVNDKVKDPRSDAVTATEKAYIWEDVANSAALQLYPLENCGMIKYNLIKVGGKTTLAEAPGSTMADLYKSDADPSLETFKIFEEGPKLSPAIPSTITTMQEFGYLPKDSFVYIYSEKGKTHTPKDDYFENYEALLEAGKGAHVKVMDVPGTKPVVLLTNGLGDNVKKGPWAIDECKDSGNKVKCGSISLPKTLTPLATNSDEAKPFGALVTELQARTHSREVGSQQLANLNAARLYERSGVFVGEPPMETGEDGAEDD